MFQKLAFVVALCIASKVNAANLPGTLIVGGEDAVKNQFPYLVRFWAFPNEGQARFCSGTLIALDLVLTSASCVEGVSRELTLVAGDHSITVDDGTEQSLLSKQIIIHENFNSSGKLENDIALIKLADKLVQTKEVRPIALASEGFNPDESEYGIAMGWGSTNASGDVGALAPTLQKANLRILDSTSCAALPIMQLADEDFCTLDTKGGLRRDLGGPLICSASLGAVCGIMSSSVTGVGPTNGIAGVYVKVSSYLEWIKSNTPVDPTTTTPPTPTTTVPTGSTGSSGGPTGSTETSTRGGSTSLAAGLTIIIFSVLLSTH